LQVKFQLQNMKLTKSPALWIS